MRTHLPDLKIRVVNIVDLMKLQPQTEHPHGAYLLKQQLADKLIEHRQCIATYGEDLPEIREWIWNA
jgi:phosphoketolase